MTVVAISAVIGTWVGVAAGWFGGAVDEVVMRIVDVLQAFPGILMNIAIVATVSRPSLGLTIAALCANGWVGYARLVRGQTLALRERDYVTAAIAMGATGGHVMRRHLAPNVLGPVLVQAAFGLGTTILVEASLSFLGLGPQIDYTWGAMLEQGTSFVWKPGLRALRPGAGARDHMGRDRCEPRARRAGAGLARARERVCSVRRALREPIKATETERVRATVS